MVLLFCTLTSHANQKIVLVLDWFLNPNHAPILIAKEQGFFAKNGLDVAIITPADPNDPPKWIAIGKGDIALDYQPHVLMAVAQGLPLKQVGTLIGRPLNALMVLKASSINRISDLKGKTIAYSAPAIDPLILKTMLNKEGLSLNDVTLINVHYDLTQALLSKKVDAAMGIMRNFELIQLKMLGQEGRVFFPEDYGVPLYSELVFITKQSESGDRFNAFFDALNSAKDYLKKHPEESWRLIVKRYDELNNPLNHAVWLNTLDEFPNKFQEININQCRKMAEFLDKTTSGAVVKKVCADNDPDPIR